MSHGRHESLLCIALVAMMAGSACSILFGEASNGEDIDTGGSQPDAQPSVCTTESCDALGGTCTLGGQCKFECAGDNCGCPADLDCLITVGEYVGEIDCSAASNCDIVCGGEGNCSNNVVVCGGDCDVSCLGEYKCRSSLTIKCGIGECNFNCLEKGSCSGVAIDCGSAELCELRCSDSACEGLDMDCAQATQCNVACPSVDPCTGADLANLTCEISGQCDFECGNDSGC